MATATTTRRSRTKKAEVDEDLEADDEAEEAPAPRKRPAAKKAAAAPKKEAPAKSEYGSAWLTEHVNDTLGTEFPATKLRAVLRRLVNDGTVELAREGRYEFPGAARNPAVKALIAALREEKKAGPSKRGRKPKASKAVAEAEELDEDAEDLDLD